MNRLTALIILFLGLSGLAYWLLQADQQASTQVLHQGILLKDFSAKAGALSKIVVKDATGVRVSLVRQGDTWQATHLDAVMTFPVDSAKVNAFINTLASARILELKTQRKENYARLGVEDIDAENAASRLVEVVSANKTWQLLLGQTAGSGKGQFVRLLGQKDSYLIDNRLDIPDTRTEWLSSKLVEWKEEDVVQATFSAGATETLSFSRDDSGEWLLEGLPEDRELKYPSILRQTVADILSFRFDDVQAYPNALPRDMKAVAEVALVNASNERVILDVYQQQDNQDYFVRVSNATGDMWVSKWMFTVSAFSAKPLLATQDSLTNSVSETPQ